MRLDSHDRRWFVPRVTENLQTHSYWIEFNAWLETGGLPSIAWWAGEFLSRESPFADGVHAPDSSLKREMINSSRSEAGRLAFDIARMIVEMEPNDKQVVVLVRDVRQHIATTLGLSWTDRNLGNIAEIGRALRDGGLKAPNRAFIRNEGRFKVKGRYEEIVSRFTIADGATWKDLELDYYDTGKLVTLLGEPEM